MTNTIPRVAGATLAVLVLGATYNVATVGAQKAGPPPLVTTACNMGQVTECGSEPARTECTRSWKVDLGWLTQTFGIGISQVTCVQIGEKKLYKDFRQGAAAGSCMVWSGVPGDGTTVRPRMDDEPAPTDAGSC